MTDERQFYTVVFEDDIRTIEVNLFKVVSPFGTVKAIVVGNVLEDIDHLENRVLDPEHVVQP